MDISSLLESLEKTGLATSIRESLYTFPFLESMHVIGLTLVFGTIAVVDFRMLGLASTHRPFRKVFSETLKWTWVAFAITLITGSLMFTTNARVYYGNTAFRTKMLMLVLAGINMAVFELTAGRSVEKWNTARSAPRAGKIAAGISLMIWLSIICLGRWIGFTVTRHTEEVPTEDINFDSLFPGAEEPPATPPVPPGEDKK